MFVFGMGGGVTVAAEQVIKKVLKLESPESSPFTTNVYVYLHDCCIKRVRVCSCRGMHVQVDAHLIPECFHKLPKYTMMT